MKHLLKIILLTGFLFAIQSHLNAQQSVIWQKEFPQPFNTYGTCITQISDGGFVMCGETQLHDTSMFVLRTNYLGDTLWSKLFPMDIAYKIIQTRDSSLIISGQCSGINGPYSDACILKINLNGDLIFLEKYGLYYSDVITDMSECRSGSFLFFGSSVVSLSPYVTKFFLLRTNFLGDSLWMKYFDSTDASGIMSKYSDNRILLTCARSVYSRAAVVDTNGNLIRLSGLPLSEGISDSLSQNFYFVSDTLGGDLKFTKLDSLFNTVNIKIIDLPNRNLSYRYILNYNNEIVICGWADNRIVSDPFGFLMKVDSIGNLIWFKDYPIGDHFSYFKNVGICSDKGFITTGTISPLAADGVVSNIWATKTDSMGNTNFVNIISYSGYVPQNYNMQQNYPNPFNSQTIIKFDLVKESEVTLFIYNTLGQRVETLINKSLNSGSYTYSYKPVSELGSGVYFYTMHIITKDENLTLTKKLLYIK